MRWFVVIVFFSFATTMISGHNGDGISENFYKRIIELFTLPMFWLSIMPALFIMFLPYYIERTYWQRFRFPEYFSK